MNPSFSLLSMTLIAFATPSLAQTKTPVKKTTPIVAAPTKSILATSTEKAKADLARVEELLKAEIKKAEGYDACKVTELKIQKKYDQWFLDHISEFETVSQKIDSVVAATNEKMSTIQDQSIQVLPVTGQTSAEVPITLSKMIDYFKLFNGRIKTCDKDSKAELIRQMEDPSNNELNVGHSQIVAAMKAMTENLNASLKEGDTQYVITFKPSSCGYTLELQVKIDVNGLKQKYDFSLLESKTSEIAKIEIGDAAKWSALSKSNSKIDQLPLDGLLRYRSIQSKERGLCGKLLNIPGIRSERPFLSYAEIEKATETMKMAARLVAEPEAPGTFMYIPGGVFKMRGGLSTVTITQGFEMQNTEVTQKQFYDVTKTNPSAYKNQNNCPESYSTEGGGMCPNNPVEQVTYPQLTIYLNALNALDDGYTYRLPTEAEWEFAARGDSTSEFGFTDKNDKLEDYAWFDANSYGKTQPVGRKKANSYGLFDMHGNVWEWNMSFHTANYPAEITDPQGAASGGRDIKGGSWSNTRNATTIGYQNYIEDNYANCNCVGFRPIRTIR